ncbi:MAG: hypothetical protein JWL86_5408 [Rhizobium sp.]|nr:hypothetical protein [Rhizobium sp.]
MTNIGQKHVRFRTDAGAADATPTWGAAEDAAGFNPGAGNFRLRASIANLDTAATGALPYEIYVSKNGGAYAAVTTSSTGGVKSVDAGADADNTSILVPRLSVPSFAYVGPGDIVGGANAWYGLRAYSAAYAAGVTKPAIDIVDSSGANTTTINVLSTGALDSSAVATFIAAHGTPSVTKVYDQTGNGFHLTQATVANMPTLVSGLGSYVFNFVSASNQAMVSSFTGPWPATPPSTVSVVARRPIPGSNNAVVGDDGGGANVFFNATADSITIAAGVNLTATGADASWHAIQAVLNTTSSDVNVDGASNIGNTGSTNPSFRFFFGDNSNGFQFNGTVAEAAVWPVAFSGANSTAMSANQRSAWGF